MFTGDRGIRAVAARVFGRPRPYTVTSLGGPTLVCAVLDQRGLVSPARRLREALEPVMRLLDVADVADLPAAFDQFRGRPPDVIAARLRTGEVAAALAEGFEALGWVELVALLDGWWPDPPVPATVGELGARAVAARNEVAAALAGRVALFREALELDPAAWDMPPVDVDRNVRRLAATLLEPGGLVPAVSRHPNRIGRLLGAGLVDRVEQATRTGDVTSAAVEVVAEAVCVVAAVAEAVTARPGVGGVVPRSLAVPGRTVPVTALGWWPSRWWPVLDAWGAASARGRSRVRTVWRLTPAAGDVTVAALLWSLGALGSVAAVGRVRSPCEWQRRWARELDTTWGPVAARVWGLMQSVRPAGERSPSPFEDGLSRGQSWRYGVPDT